MPKVTIYIKDSSIKKIDKFCKENRFSRSELLVMGAERIMEDYGFSVKQPKESKRHKRLAKHFDNYQPKVINTPKQAKEAVKEPQDKVFFNPVPKPTKKKRR